MNVSMFEILCNALGLTGTSSVPIGHNSPKQIRQCC